VYGVHWMCRELINGLGGVLLRLFLVAGRLEAGEKQVGLLPIEWVVW